MLSTSIVIVSFDQIALETRVHVLVCYEFFNFLRILQIDIDSKMIQVVANYLDCLLFQPVVLELQQCVDDFSFYVSVYIARVE
jgi:hypothetical protein